MEVGTTRLEFQEDGGSGDAPSVAVRALIASGGYVTLFSVAAGPANARGPDCAGGSGAGAAVLARRADPVPLGTYRVTSPAGLTQGVGVGSRPLAELRAGAYVDVVETRVEGGCVRGRAAAVMFEREDGSIAEDAVSGCVRGRAAAVMFEGEDGSIAE